jgi:hypothetical protein
MEGMEELRRRKKKIKVEEYVEESFTEKEEYVYTVMEPV